MVIGFTNECSSIPLNKITPTDFVRWVNNNGKADESSTHQWLKKASENMEISPSINPKLSMAAKRHLVFNFWRLSFDNEKGMIFYTPPDQNHKIWSLTEACSINIKEDRKLEEEMGFRRKKTVIGFTNECSSIPLNKLTPTDFVRWVNNNGKADESSTQQWLEKASENMEISPSINPKLSMAAKRHLVFNFWRLSFDNEKDKIFYTPPEQNHKIWSLTEACSINIKEDRKLEEEMGFKGLRKNQVFEDMNEEVSLQSFIWKEVEVGQQSKWVIMKHMNNIDASQEQKLQKGLQILSFAFPGNTNFIRQLIYNIGPFSEFCSCILQTGGEVASIATFRVHNKENIAEIPFVATNNAHKGRGSCKLLMKELENSLRQLQVERILLPSCPNVRHMWETKFGFKRMNKIELATILEREVQIINFTNTVMCHKFLI